MHKKALSQDEVERIIRRDIEGVPSGSMFESCLRKHPIPTVSIQKTVSSVISSLEQDEVRFSGKYAGKDRCAYTIPLPSGPQHNKYTAPHAHGQQDPALPKKTKRHVPRFNLPTLRGWFAEMDADGSGSISRTELIGFLRANEDLRAFMFSATGAGESQHDKTDAIGLRNQELKRLIKVMNEVDEDGSGTMEWDEFVEFFSRSGYLLKYEWNEKLNDMTLEPTKPLEQASTDLAQVLDLAQRSASALETQRNTLKREDEMEGSPNWMQSYDANSLNRRQSRKVQSHRRQSL